MKPYFVTIPATVTLIFASLMASVSDNLPAGWEIIGDAPDLYVGGIDDKVDGGTGDAKYLKFTEGNKISWAILMQSISAKQYSGQRVRYQARIKTRGVDEYWAGIYFQVRKDNGRNALFYNSWDAPMKGDNDWQVRSVVFDVPEDAGTISYGVMDGGRGQVWADSMKFEVVGKDVPVSQVQKVPGPLKKTPSL